MDNFFVDTQSRTHTHAKFFVLRFSTPFYLRVWLLATAQTGYRCGGHTHKIKNLRLTLSPPPLLRPPLQTLYPPSPTPPSPFPALSSQLWIWLVFRFIWPLSFLYQYPHFLFGFNWIDTILDWLYLFFRSKRGPCNILYIEKARVRTSLSGT